MGIPLCWDLRKVNNYQLSLTGFHCFSLIKPVILGGTLKQITNVWELGFGVNFSFSLYFAEMEGKAGESYQKHDLGTAEQVKRVGLGLGVGVGAARPGEVS